MGNDDMNLGQADFNVNFINNKILKNKFIIRIIFSYISF